MVDDADNTPKFKVEDRRRFDSEGRTRPASADSTGAGADRASAVPPPGGAGEASASERSSQHSGQLNFTSFVIGLASQAFVFLGLAPESTSTEPRKDLDQARMMIDVLAMLQVKTTGNRTEDEDRLMEELLYELRMRFVHESKSTKTEAPGS
jgi:hypothetical protein